MWFWGVLTTLKLALWIIRPMLKRAVSKSRSEEVAATLYEQDLISEEEYDRVLLGEHVLDVVGKG